MLTGLLIVVDPILHPVPARSGDILAWYAARGITVFRRVGSVWRVVRKLSHDNAGALAALMADGAIVPASAAHEARLRQALPSADRSQAVAPAPQVVG